MITEAKNIVRTTTTTTYRVQHTGTANTIYHFDNYAAAAEFAAELNKILVNPVEVHMITTTTTDQVVTVDPDEVVTFTRTAGNATYWDVDKAGNAFRLPGWDDKKVD